MKLKIRAVGGNICGPPVAGISLENYFWQIFCVRFGGINKWLSQIPSLSARCHKGIELDPCAQFNGVWDIDCATQILALDWDINEKKKQLFKNIIISEQTLIALIKASETSVSLFSVCYYKRFLKCGLTECNICCSSAGRGSFRSFLQMENQES